MALGAIGASKIRWRIHRSTARRSEPAPRKVDHAHWPRSTGTAAVRGIPDSRPPARGWLRVSATSAYRLAVNGSVIDEQETRWESRICRLRRCVPTTSAPWCGRATTDSVCGSPIRPTVPHVSVDLEVLDAHGNHLRLASDETGMSVAGLPEDWFETDLSASRATPSGRRSSWKLAILAIRLGRITRRFVNLFRRLSAGMLHSSWTSLAVQTPAVSDRNLIGCVVVGHFLPVPPSTPNGDAAFLCRCRPHWCWSPAGWPVSIRGSRWTDLSRSAFALRLGGDSIQWLVWLSFDGSRGVCPLEHCFPRRRPVRCVLVATLAIVGASLGSRCASKSYKARELGADEVHMYRCTMGCLDAAFPVTWSATICRCNEVRPLRAASTLARRSVAHFSDDPLVICVCLP